MAEDKIEYPYDPHPRTFTPLSEKEIATFAKGISGCDPGLIRLVRKLNESGYTTTGSCSGLTEDHKRSPQHSYLWFAKTDKDKANNLVKAADSAGLLITYHGEVLMWGHPGKEIQFEMMEVRSPRRPKTDEEIHQAWDKFEKELLG